MNIVPVANINASDSSLAYIVESLDMWHGRLGHVNIALVKKLKELKLINAYETHETSKCLVCVEAKFIKQPFKPILSRSTKLLELIHSNLANFKNTTSRGRQNYYISFVVLKSIF